MSGTDDKMVRYYNALNDAVKDLEISSDERQKLMAMQKSLGLSIEQIRACHAKMLAAAIIPFVNDNFLDDDETEKLDGLCNCFCELGWAPGLQTKNQKSLNTATIASASSGITVVLILLASLLFHGITPKSTKSKQPVGTEINPNTWEAFWMTTVLEEDSFSVAEKLNMTAANVRKAKSNVRKRIIKCQQKTTTRNKRPLKRFR